ncbi:PASTA domain-containing protein [bacterium]|nr:PASTA domain-containing protein [bacterium]
MKRTKRESKQERRSLQNRIRLVAGLVVFCLLAVVARSWFVQIVKHDYYLARQQQQRSSNLLVTCDRGEILAADGGALAITVKGESLFADPRNIDDKERIAQALAPIIGQKVATLKRRLSGDRGFVWLKRTLTPSQIKALKPWCEQEAGLAFFKENQRVYPNRELAGQVLGFTNIDCCGQEGLERHYDKYLQGRTVCLECEYDAKRKLVDSLQNPELNCYKGKTVYLTIDRHVQSWTEEALATAVTKSQGRSGVALVMDADDGALLAMAHYPRFNPNSKRKNNPSLWRNRAAVDLLEPGSTFKVFTLVAALESGLFKIDDQIDCEEGKYKVGRRTIHDTHEYGLLRLDEILKFSSNIGCSKIVEQLGAERFHAVLKKFGFGSRSGIDYPHEPSGRLRSWQKWRAIDLCNVAFGQGVSMTSVQLTAAYAALANGGYRVTPHLVAKIVNGAGWTVYEHQEDGLPKRACSAEVARQVDAALGLVVEDDGTAPKARITGFRVAGKTGTAQKFDFEEKSYSHSNYWASFVGYVDPPAGQSRKVVYVMVDEPKSSIYGGMVAAPAFRKINRRLVSYFNYARNSAVAKLTVSLSADEDGLVGRAGISEGVVVVDNADVVDLQSSQAELLVPDFTGQTIREALTLIGDYRNQIKISGQGRIIAQEPVPGSRLEPGLNFVFKLSSEI